MLCPFAIFCKGQILWETKFGMSAIKTHMSVGRINSFSRFFVAFLVQFYKSNFFVEFSLQMGEEIAKI